MTAKEGVVKFFDLLGIAKIQDTQPRQFLLSKLSIPNPMPDTMKMINPRGSTKVLVKQLGNNQFLLSPTGLALAGIYQLDDNRLIMIKPEVPHNNIFTWELQGEDYFVQTANKKYIGHLLRFDINH